MLDTTIKKTGNRAKFPTTPNPPSRFRFFPPNTIAQALLSHQLGLQRHSIRHQYVHCGAFSSVPLLMEWTYPPHHRRDLPGPTLILMWNPWFTPIDDGHWKSQLRLVFPPWFSATASLGTAPLKTHGQSRFNQPESRTRRTASEGAVPFTKGR